MPVKKSPCVIETINFGSFPGKCMFSVGYTFDEIILELKKQKLPLWVDAFSSTKQHFTDKTAGFAAHRTISVKGIEYDFSFLHLRDRFDWSDKSHWTLSHEAIHIVTYQLGDMLDIQKENEAFAYTHTHILKQCYNVMRLKQKK